MSVLSIVGAMSSLIALQAGMDMAAIEKWSTAKLVRYHVEGVHDARAAVVHGDYEGKADVIDRILVEFTWDVGAGKVVGPVKVTDGKSELTNIKSDGTNCPAPKLNGEYEHFQSASTSMTGSDQIQITGVRTYPAALVSNYPAGCSMRAIPGAKEQVIVWIAGVEPASLGLPITKGAPLSVSADRKSFSIQGAGNWIWTYTPTRLR